MTVNNAAKPPRDKNIGKQPMGPSFVQAISVPHHIDEKDIALNIKYNKPFFILFMFAFNFP
jgi:hypothetical protein